MRKISLSIFAAVAIATVASSALAQSSTTGAIRGVVRDTGGAPVAGATVVASSPMLQGTQAEISNAQGVYYLGSLPPGTYSVTVYYDQAKFARNGIIVSLGKVAPVNLRINLQEASGEVIELEGTAPVIDSGSTKTGVVINEDYTKNVPTGRTFQGTLNAAAGSQGDLYGISFGGSTSAENTYIIEGVNVTDPAFGGGTSLGTTTNLPNEFVTETEIITGGYNAEFGRSTGAVVNVVTKSGSNEFHGSVFSYFTPNVLAAGARELPREGSSISSQSQLAYQLSLGGELGGPIIKDKLWFHVGFNPVFNSTDIDRLVSSQVDLDGDGVPDVDPSTGFGVRDIVQSDTLNVASQDYLFTGKLSYAASPNHQGALSVFGSPGQGDSVGSLSGPASAGDIEFEDGAYDISTKWTSKFNNNKTQIDFVGGYHENRDNTLPATAAGDTNQVRFDNIQNLALFNGIDRFGVPDACVDGTASDPFPMIANCPVQFYNIGGLGFRSQQEASRLAAGLKLTQRVQAAGFHQIKVGADWEEQNYVNLNDFTGGTRFRYRDTSVRVDRYFTPTDRNFDPNSPFDATVGGCGADFTGGPDGGPDGIGDVACAFQENGLTSDSKTRNFAAFLQDSWSILPNLTLNAGIRWESQELFTSRNVQGSVSPTTGEPIPETAFKINDNWAPRLGLIYDWTQEGRSKVFANYGRYYESIPMDINARAYGGEVFTVDVLLPDSCTSPDAAVMNPGGVQCNFEESAFNGFFGGGEELATPGLRGQYLDEIVAGVEYELFQDFKVGASYIFRGLGRIIEDVSVDGANTYIITNPGETVSQSDIDSLIDQAAAEEAAGNMAKAAFLRDTASSFSRTNIFDEPVRRYNAVQLTASKRFSKDLFVLASYTLSNLEGNFPGLFSADTGQLDPNLTSMYDLPELLSNRFGNLNADRPHLLNVDGFYNIDLNEQGIGEFIVGGSFRAASGIPINTQGAQALYGFGESFILPRGVSGMGDNRTPFQTSLDLRLQYAKNIGDGLRIQGFVDLFNVYNSQRTTGVDDNYTFDDINPIVGGDREDLEHAKSLNSGTGTPDGTPITVNPNYASDTGAQSPFFARLGFRLIF